MTGPAVPQEACGGQPRSNGNNPRWARIVNPVLNQSSLIRRKDAERLVNQGRAAWVSTDQLRLNLAHEANQRAAAGAAAGYEWPVGKVATVGELLAGDGTRPVRADNQCRRALGQVIGHPRLNREFREGVPELNLPIP